jgi:signal transduction histidine kinase
LSVTDAVALDHQLLTSAIDSLVDGFALVDSTGHVVYWNLRADEFLHLSPDQMLGARREEMIAQVASRTTNPETIQRQLLTAFDHPSPEVAIELQTNLDPPRFLAARVSAIRESGAALILRDVSREREADAMKSQLLSTVSHELRTPLASIKGFASTLLRQDVSWNESEQRDFLRIIEDETDRLTEIIDNLLDMSQIEAGALRIEKEPTQLRALIRELVDAMRMRTEAHWFVVDLPNELPRALADPRRVRQVIRNLLDNAVKYSKGGQITVSCHLEGDFVVVSVSDQGEGISPQYLSKVFDRFFQVDGKSTRRLGGSGLGLSISRGIVQAHGGKMWAESVVGQGSTFRFTLPVASGEGA